MKLKNYVSAGLLLLIFVGCNEPFSKKPIIVNADAIYYGGDIIT